MARTKEQKIKLLLLYDLLRRHTDEDHALTTGQIIELLKAKGVDVSRKVLPNDIELLNEFGYEVMTKKGHPNGYYVIDHTFDPSEVKLFSDAIHASKLTEGHKARLIRRISETICEHQESVIGQSLLVYDMPKRSNSNILYHIDLISKAISEKKKVSFLYYSLDEHKQKVYRKDGGRYFVNPLVMVWSKDNYYLLSYHDHHEGLTNYRIDHMDDVRIEDMAKTERAEYENFKTEEYRKQVFSMFGGKVMDVELSFPKEMIDDIYDKFSESIQIRALDNNMFHCTVPVQISKTFFGWVAGSCGKVHILSPESVVSDFKGYIDQIKAAY